MASLIYSLFSGFGQDNSFKYCKVHTEAKEGESAVYRSESSFKELKFTPDNECFTMQDVFLRACRLYPHKKYLGTIDASLKSYNW